MVRLGKLIDLTGQKFGRLTVLYKDNSIENRTYWICQCDCGVVKSIFAGSLKSGSSKSCGCINKELRTKHNKSETRIYRIYNHMKNRCCNAKNKGYKNYGARGIKVCNEWLNKENGFINFYNWAIENGYQDDLTIDRINNDGNYEPGNCRWANYETQNNNTSRNKKVTINGITKNMTEWCHEHNLHVNLLYSRMKRGIVEEELLIKPNKGRKYADY